MTIIRSCFCSALHPKFVSRNKHFNVELTTINSVFNMYGSKILRTSSYMSSRGEMTADDMRGFLKISKNYADSILDRLESDGVVFIMYARGGRQKYYLCNKAIQKTDGA